MRTEQKSPSTLKFLKSPEVDILHQIPKKSTTNKTFELSTYETDAEEEEETRIPETVNVRRIEIKWIGCVPPTRSYPASLLNYVCKRLFYQNARIGGRLSQTESLRGMTEYRPPGNPSQIYRASPYFRKKANGMIGLSLGTYRMHPLLTDKITVAGQNFTLNELGFNDPCGMVTSTDGRSITMKTLLKSLSQIPARTSSLRNYPYELPIMQLGHCWAQ